MPTLDSTAIAQIDSGRFAPAWYVWLDILTDPIRVTNYGLDRTFSATGDADLNGQTFTAFAGEFLEIGDVANSDNGSDTLTITLSGIVTLDTALLNAIGNVADWQGRTGRVWFQLYEPTGATVQGAVVAHYTGYMSSVSIKPGPKSQTIELTLENYLAAFNDASNRNYLSQSTYDAADTSAAATIAASNASRHIGGNASSSSGGTGTGGAGGGSGSGVLNSY